MYDAIVVGARCAGSPTAMLLARTGLPGPAARPGHVPRATPSRPTTSTSPASPASRAGGCSTQVVASNCPPVRAATVDVGPFALAGAPPPADGVADGYAPRADGPRPILVEAAAAAGAEVREHFARRRAALTDGDRVTGIRGHAAAARR